MNTGPLPSKELAQFVAAAPRVVQTELCRHLDLLDLTRLFQQLEAQDVQTLSRKLVQIQGPAKLRQLVMHVLRREKTEYCPFLAHVISGSNEALRLPLVRLVVNQSTNAQLDALFAAPGHGLGAEMLGDLLAEDAKSISADAIKAVNELWRVKTLVYSDPDLDELRATDEFGTLPAYKSFELLRQESSSHAERSWLNRALCLMHDHCNDLMRVHKDWPGQRKQYEQICKEITVHTSGQKVLRTCAGYRQTLRGYAQAKGRGLRIAWPSINMADLCLVEQDLSSRPPSKWLLAPLSKTLRARFTKIIEQHDRQLHFPQAELAISGAADLRIIEISKLELGELVQTSQRLEGEQAETAESKLTCLSEIESLRRRSRYLLAMNIKHLRRYLFSRGVGLLTQRLLVRMESCPQVREKIQALLNEKLLGKEGLALYYHCTELQQACSTLNERLDALAKLHSPGDKYAI